MKTSVGADHAALLGKTGRGVVVATIDSGVANGHPHVGLVSGGVSIQKDGTTGQDFGDRIGHGTAVAAVIREKAVNATLLAVRVFHAELSTDIEALVRGIDWATQQGAHLINLSLGTSDPKHQQYLASAVSRAVEHGVLIVSARKHRGRPWWPGSLHDVLPVVLDPSCDRMTINVQTQDGRKMFGASGLPRPIPGVPTQQNLKGISFAVANVTGLIARLIEGSTVRHRPAELFNLLQNPPRR